MNLNDIKRSRTPIDGKDILLHNDVEKISIRQLAEMVENKYNISTYISVISLRNYSGKELYIEPIKKWVTGSAKASIYFEIERREFTKVNVYKTIKDILLDGKERRILNSTNPGVDSNSCKYKESIYSLAFIKRHVFGMSKTTSKHRVFRDMLLDLEKDGKIKVLTNAIGSVIGCELLDRSKSKAEQLLNKLYDATKIGGITCGLIYLHKNNAKFFKKKEAYNSKYDFYIKVDPKNDDSFKLYVNRKGVYYSYMVSTFNVFDDLLEYCNFYDEYEKEVALITDSVISDINRELFIDLSYDRTIQFDDNGFFFNISYNELS